MATLGLKLSAGSGKQVRPTAYGNAITVPADKECPLQRVAGS
jgi:hypothetical protein